MNIEQHIYQIKSEMSGIIYSEIAQRYKDGIAYLTFDELPEIRRLWNARNSFGEESVIIALERIMFSEDIKDYIDGLAIGNSPIEMIHKGLYWDFKMTDQIWDIQWEFGPEGCKYRMLDSAEIARLKSRLLDNQDIGRFVFLAMKEICLYKSMRLRKIKLADNWKYQSSIRHEPEILNNCVEALKDFLCDRGFQVRMFQPRGSIFSGKSKTLDGTNDIEIAW